MRLRTLVAIVGALCALPVLAAEPPRAGFTSELTRPGNPETLVAIADVRLDCAGAATTSAADRAELLADARRGYEQALRADPNHAAARLGLARCGAREGRRAETVAAYRTYLTGRPQDVAVVREVALLHASWHDWAQAAAWCEFALKMDPQCRDTHLALAAALAHAGRGEAALPVLSRIMPEPQARVRIAIALKDQGRTEESVRQLERALEVDPTCAQARELLTGTGALASAAPVAPGGVASSFGPARLPFAPGVLAGALADRVIAYKLRNVAAADVAHAFAAFSQGKGWTARIDCDAANNNLIVRANGTVHAQLERLVSELDRAPAQVVMQIMVIQVPRSFITTSGLNAGGAGGANGWVLSARERVMFNGLLRGAKEEGQCEVLSYPRLHLSDGQTGHLHVGQQVPVAAPADIKTVGWVVVPERTVHHVSLGLTARVSPRVSADGTSVALTTEAQMIEALRGTVKVPVTIHHPGLPYPLTSFTEMPAFRTVSMRSATDLKFGESLVAEMCDPAASFLGRLRCAADQDGTTTLVIVTPHLVRHEEPARPAGWFVK